MKCDGDGIYTTVGLKRMGVRKLRTFGFMKVTPGNITGDEVYRYHFVRYLRELHALRNGADNELAGLLKLMENEHNADQ